MSTLKVNTLLAADGNPATPVAIPGLDKRFATAWVNFNGVGVVAIRKAYNVASITDNGVGDYTVNFSTPLATADCTPCAVGGADGLAGGSAYVACVGNCATTSVKVFGRSIGPTTAAVDIPIAAVHVFGGQA